MSNSEIIDVEPDAETGQLRIEDQSQDRPRIGRPPGAINKAKREMQEIARMIVDKNAENIERWLSEVANGKPSQIVAAQPEFGIAGGIIPGLDPDPAKAIDLLVKIAEFGAPKATRAPLLGDDGTGGMVVPVVNLKIARRG